MGRNKMEKDFSGKLNQREINPSANAWDRLDAMLAVAEEKKPKRNFSWMYIAASIAGFLLIGTVYLSSTEEIIDVKREEVVFEDNPKLKPTKSDILNAAAQNAISAEVAENPVRIEKNANGKKSIKQIQNIKKINQSQLAQNTINQPNVSEQINQNQNSIINQKTDNKSAVANTLKADELLAMAQTKSNAETSKTYVKVNAKNLLSEVDGEVSQSFRDKVINSVGKNYRNAKVAIANRNQIEEDNH